MKSSSDSAWIIGRWFNGVCWLVAVTIAATELFGVYHFAPVAWALVAISGWGLLGHATKALGRVRAALHASEFLRASLAETLAKSRHFVSTSNESKQASALLEEIDVLLDRKTPDARRTEHWSLRTEVAEAMKEKSNGLTGRQLDQCWLELADVAIERVLAAVADEPAGKA